MPSKKLFYSFIIALIFLATGAGLVSAHGFLNGFYSVDPQQAAQGFQSMIEQKAKALGMSTDEFKAAWAKGKNFQEIAQEQGLTQEQLQQKMQALKVYQMKTRLQSLVTQGVLTQAQADQRWQFMQNQSGNNLGKTWDWGLGNRGRGCH